MLWVKGGADVVRISELLWDEWNEEHVARHGVDPGEVDEVARNRPLITTARDGLYRKIGQTDAGRYLTAYVAPEHRAMFYVVTARDATEGERRAFRRR
jgi:hypothetical protein